MASTYEQLAQRYIAVWNESDPAKRREDIARLWTDGGSYIDPIAAANGPEAIDATIAAVQAQFPGMTFSLTGPVDGHHNQFRFAWELGPAGAPAPIAGSDVAVTDDDGRLSQVLGFLDRVPTV